MGLAFSLGISVAVPVWAPASSDWKKVWSDEFTSSGPPDPKKWQFETGGHGWGNRELQYYTDRRANSRVERGHLVIEVRREDYQGSRFTSARLISSDRTPWKYGRFEVRARLPLGRGIWPAIWMLPAKVVYGKGIWPDGGEIDIMEHVGHEPDRIRAGLNTNWYKWLAGTQKDKHHPVEDPHEKFHVYAVEWTEEDLKWFVDDEMFYTYKNPHTDWKEWPFDQPFRLLLNVAVGGVWAGDKGIDESTFPQKLLVDFVRVYARNLKKPGTDKNKIAF